VLVDKKAIIDSQSGTVSRNSSVLLSLKEGFQMFQIDLSKLQVATKIFYSLLNVKQFIELNATGFAKALKKWDKRSKSQTKELYLSRQVEGTVPAPNVGLTL
jgi:CDK inhibitor PHO81